MPSPNTVAQLNKNTKRLAKRESLWEGPNGTGPNGGITQSMLHSFLACRERFRLRYVEGLDSRSEFNSRMEFGNIWHTAEEAHAANQPIEAPLLAYAKKLVAEHPLDAAEVDKWYNVIRRMFPIYADYWKHNDDVKQRTPVYQEKVFDVSYGFNTRKSAPYNHVRLRGKFDAVDLIGSGKKAGLYIQENKTKSEVNEEQIKRQLPMDLQSMVYLTALNCTDLGPHDGKPIAGIRYNVIRRPLSGGKHSISQRKGLGKAKKGAETPEEFYDRLAGLIKDNPKDFFLRCKMEVTTDELIEFQRRCLNPILTQLCDWWDSIKANPFNPWNSPLHWVTPYGGYSTMSEGRTGLYDDLIATGNRVGLRKSDSLFTELQ